MKKLTALSLSIAICAVPTFAYSADFWVEIEGKDCKVWSDEPVANANVSWTGACIDGLASGEGQLEWKSEGKLVLVYDGAMAGGKLNGLGVAKVYDEAGSVTTTEAVFVDGQADGVVSMEDAKGNIFQGSLVDGRPDGIGFARVNDEEYFGGFENGARNGLGFVISDKEIYVGEFKENVASGSGVVEDNKGGRFHGQFADGVPNGYGTYVAADGVIYQGKFKDGVADGRFFVISPDSDGAEVQIWENGEKVQ